jgi:hypothetical protein
MSIYNPYEGEIKVDVFQLDDPNSKASYEQILNNPSCTVIREEFSYVGPIKSNPIITVWYEDNS